MQYVLTWGETWTEYGGQQAFDDWEVFRDFILENDMADPANYQLVKDQMQVLSLIDYIIVNLNSVCSDWMNYNTGWWRGIDPEGGHKKWGYILWDNDATFDYYINYSGVPNTNPDAVPCDFEEIGEYMDDFFSSGGFSFDSTFISGCNSIQSGSCPYSAGDQIVLLVMEEDFGCCWGQWDSDCQNLYDELYAQLVDSLDYDNCTTILNGSSPYSPDDPFYQSVTELDNYCCNTNWDDYCQATYELAASGVDIDPIFDERIRENFGKHEKIFFKLLDESPEFKQLYYSRQADMINTAWSCEVMTSTLDSMVAIIDPEMDRHIARWGGSRFEWERNVNDLREFIEQRCQLLDDGMLDCYEVTGPYNLTLEISPPGAGDIDLNTIEVKNFPWTGKYFGGMENIIDADPGPDYDFVRWESKSGQAIFPSTTDENASITLTGNDTLVAIFKLETVATKNVESDNVALSVYPSPTSNFINIKYQLDQTSLVKISLYNALGEQVYELNKGKKQAKELQSASINISNEKITSGTYIVKIDTEHGSAQTKVIVVR